jgi:RimJ/RimL family protein N-acetyltransferase
MRSWRIGPRFWPTKATSSRWGKGIATRALTLFLQQGTVRPLYAHVARHNLASIRVLEKCGFTIANEEGEEVVLIFHE